MPNSFSISPGEVHIWRVDLGLWSGVLAELSAEERARAARFRWEDVRRRWAAGRAALRLILERYTGTPAAELLFARGEYGKPYLAGSPVRFNMTDSGDLALYAVALDAEIGVDIERVRPIDGVGISRRFLPAPEAAAVRDDPASFFRIWTRREAYLKCIGVGLRRIDAPIEPGYSIADLEPAAGYAGAAVWQGAGRRLVVRDFQTDQATR
jgi:4'-phosphopantetheinyl transferase